MIRQVAMLALIAASLIAPSAAAQQPPAQQPPLGRPSWEQRCAPVLPQQAVDPILARYRDRLRTAQENLRREEQALRALLVADNSTRAAVDTQSRKAIDARNALLRVRLDILWELRSAIPAQNREQAFRCAEVLMMRRR